MSRFGRMVKELRQKKDVGIEAVAKAVGTHKGYISGIECSTVNPPSEKLCRKLARYFNQDEAWFVKVMYVDKAPALIQDELAQKILGENH